MRTLVAIIVMLTLTVSAQAEFQYDFNVTGVNSWDELWDMDNEIYTPDLAVAAGLPAGTALEMIGVGYGLTIQTNGASWLSEARIYFDDVINPDGVGLYLSPGFADEYSGNHYYSSGGIVYLADVGMPNILLPNGQLRMEFNDKFDDYPDEIDARWYSGTVSIVYTPEPAGLALLALGGFSLRRRV